MYPHPVRQHAPMPITSHLYTCSQAVSSNEHRHHAPSKRARTEKQVFEGIRFMVRVERLAITDCTSLPTHGQKGSPNYASAPLRAIVY